MRERSSLGRWKWSHTAEVEDQKPGPKQHLGKAITMPPRSLRRRRCIGLNRHYHHRRTSRIPREYINPESIQGLTAEELKIIRKRRSQQEAGSLKMMANQALTGWEARHPWPAT